MGLICQRCCGLLSDGRVPGRDSVKVICPGRAPQTQGSEWHPRVQLRNLPHSLEGPL